ncbi:MAG: LapA family protein [Deltaproteobacteria bacterium]|nr:LapA family protein [Deltaproteobacteria bacterium]
MSFRVVQLEQIRADLNVLIARHHRTRNWFWRTGAASLVAAALWIIISIFASENRGVKESLAIIVGAFLMWLLFLWAFMLLRKLNRLTAEVKKLEIKLIERMSVESLGGDDSTG